jgi:ankyrin repeat protein
MTECTVCKAVQAAKPPRQDCCGLRVCDTCVQRLGHAGCPVCTSNVRARTKLHDYAAAGDARKVRKHLSKGAVVAKCDERGWTPLHFACKAGQAECVQLLLAAHADPDAADDSGWTPLMEAAWGNFLDTVLVLLLDERVTVNKQDKDGWTALHASAFKGHEDCALRLVEHGGDIHKGDGGGQTPGMLAAQCNHSALAVVLGQGRVSTLPVSAGPTAAGPTAVHMYGLQHMPEPEPEPEPYQPQPQPQPTSGAHSARPSLGQPLVALDPFEAATREARGPPPRPGPPAHNQASLPDGRNPATAGATGPPRPRPPPGEPPVGSPQPRPPTSAPPKQVRTPCFFISSPLH